MDGPLYTYNLLELILNLLKVTLMRFPGIEGLKTAVEAGGEAGKSSVPPASTKTLSHTMRTLSFIKKGTFPILTEAEVE